MVRKKKINYSQIILDENNLHIIGWSSGSFRPSTYIRLARRHGHGHRELAVKFVQTIVISLMNIGHVYHRHHGRVARVVHKLIQRVHRIHVLLHASEIINQQHLLLKSTIILHLHSLLMWIHLMPQPSTPFSFDFLPRFRQLLHRILVDYYNIFRLSGLVLVRFLFLFAIFEVSFLLVFC